MKNSRLNGMVVMMLIPAMLFVLFATACHRDNVESTDSSKSSESSVFDFTQYTIYCYNTDASMNAGYALRKEINDTYKQTVLVKAAPDTGNDEATNKRIYVGAVNQTDAKNSALDLRSEDYHITVTDNLIIFAGSDLVISSAVDYFCTTYMSSKSFTLPSNLDYHNTVEYPVTTFTIGGITADKYIIAYESENVVKAKKLQTVLSKLSGYYIPIVNNKATIQVAENKIVLSTDSEQVGPMADGYYSYEELNGSLTLSGNSDTAITEAIDKLLEQYFGYNENNRTATVTTVEIPSGIKEKCQFSISLEQAKATPDAQVSGRNDFVFGVSGHSGVADAYPEETVEEQVRLVAESGAKLYRFDAPVGTTADKFVVMDKVVDLCKAYGLQMMVNVGGYWLKDDELTNTCKFIAKRYKGKIDYYQIFNETDIYCLKDPGNSTFETKYDMDKVKTISGKMKLGINALREVDPNAKLIVNFTYWRSDIVQYFINDGVKFDIVGFDWYSGMGSIGKQIDDMIKLFPNHDFFICECNLIATAKYTEQQQSDFLTNTMIQMYKYSDRLKGLVVYELFDQTKLETGDKYSEQAHYGIVVTDGLGDVLKPKKSFTDIQKLLGGSSIEKVFTIKKVG